MSGVQLLLSGDPANGATGCYLAMQTVPGYEAAVLLNPGGTDVWVALQSPQTASNAYCKLYGERSTFQRNVNNTITVHFEVEFFAPLAGSKYRWVWATDAGGGTYGMTAHGSWWIGQATNPTYTLLTGAGSGMSSNFELRATDLESWQNLDFVQFLLNYPGLTGAGACYLAYSRPANSIILIDAEGSSGWLPLPPGNPGSFEQIAIPASNSRCIVNLGSGVTRSGTDITVKWNVAFQTAFAGQKHAWVLL